jgi:hypothetical protein
MSILLGGGGRDAEPDVAAAVQQVGGPVRDQLVLRVDKVPAAAAQRCVVQQERLPIGAELALADPHPAAQDRAGQAVAAE